jgi:hypothetical protein
MRQAWLLVLAISFGSMVLNCKPNETDTKSPADASNKPLIGLQHNTSQEDATPTPAPRPAEEPRESPDTKTPQDEQAAKVKVNTIIPEFDDYPVKKVFEGSNAPLKLNSETRMFKTRFKRAAEGPPNFAGRYIVATWGCGTDCLMGGLIDAKTGETYMIPFSICCIYEKDPEAEKVEIRKNSRLIKFNGLLNENEGDNYKHFFLFENSKFVRIAPGS